jgi:hypothetical protein
MDGTRCSHGRTLMPEVGGFPLTSTIVRVSPVPCASLMFIFSIKKRRRLLSPEASGARSLHTATKTLS